MQSPVPADAPCNVTPGAPTLIFPGHPEAFSINGSFIYIADYNGVARMPIAGGAIESVPVTGAPEGPLASFVVATGAVFFDGVTGTLTKVPISGDSCAGPTYSARSSPYAAMAFDGLNVYSGQVIPGGAIRRWPVDGSAQVATPLSEGVSVQAIAAAADGAYVALLTVTNMGQTSTGSIAKVTLDGSGPVVLAKDVGEPSAIAVDEEYVYFAATRGDLDTGGLFRMSFDGTGLTKLAEPSPLSIAVDEHSVFFLRNSAIYKLDKTGAGAPTKIGPAQLFGGVLVNGGNVYWSGATDGAGVAAGIYTACK